VSGGIPILTGKSFGTIFSECPVGGGFGKKYVTDTWELLPDPTIKKE
jgi:hypothetical protein